MAAAITSAEREGRVEDDKVIGHLDDERVVASTAREPHTRRKRRHVYMLGSRILLVR